MGASGEVGGRATNSELSHLVSCSSPNKNQFSNILLQELHLSFACIRSDLFLLSSGKQEYCVELIFILLLEKGYHFHYRLSFHSFFHVHMSKLFFFLFLLFFPCLNCSDEEQRVHVLEILLDKNYPKCPPSISAVCFRSIYLIC